MEYNQCSCFTDDVPSDVLIEFLSYRGGMINRNVKLENVAAKRIAKLESENERLRSMNQAKLDMIHDLMNELESFKKKVEDILLQQIQSSRDGYEEYDFWIENAAEDIYHDIFGIWPWEENNGKQSNSAQIP